MSTLMTAERADRVKARLLRAKQEADAQESHHLSEAVRELVWIVADLLDQVEDLRAVIAAQDRPAALKSGPQENP